MVDGFLRKMKDALLGQTDEQQQSDVDIDPNAPNSDRPVRPASEDPYGDPADQQFGNVRPASEDPYGDPADQQFGNVRPASEDSYGDPADEERVN